VTPAGGAERNQNALEIPSTTPPTTTALEKQQPISGNRYFKSAKTHS
jgi:hypothetical protein